MLVLAEGLALAIRARGLVTGDALGQVSSQTLPNLGVVQNAVTLPVLRPLVSASKDEILADARRVGTYEASSKVPEYCGLTPDGASGGSGGAATHTTIDEVVEAETALDRGTLSSLLDERATLDLRALDLKTVRSASLAIEDLEAFEREMGGKMDDVVWLDVRSHKAYESWHPPGAILLGFPAALDEFRDLDPAAEYVVYCEVGLKSAQLAEAMAAAAYGARHVAGGFRKVLRWAERRHDPALRAALSPVLLD